MLPELLQAMPEVVNPLLRDWALPGMVGGPFVIAAPAVYWLASKKSEEITALRVKILSSLAELFRPALLGEARAIFREMDDHLPGALSQADARNPEATRFDEFCIRLKDTDLDLVADDARERIKEELRLSLGGILVDQVEKWFKGIEEGNARVGDTPSSADSLPLALGAGTVGNLEYLGAVAHKARKAETRFFWWRKMVVRCFFPGFPLALSCAVPLFWDTRWAYWTCIASLLVLLPFLFGLFISLAVSTQGFLALSDLASRAETGEDLKHYLKKRMGWKE